MKSIVFGQKSSRLACIKYLGSRGCGGALHVAAWFAGDAWSAEARNAGAHERPDVAVSGVAAGGAAVGWVGGVRLLPKVAQIATGRI